MSEQENGGKSAGDANDAKKDADSKQGADAKEGADSKEEKPSPLKDPKVRLTLIIATVVVVLGIIVFTIYYFTRGRYYQKTNDAYLQADQVSIAPRVSGYVDEVLVGDNQTIAAGQVLARIESRTFEAKAAQDQAQIDEGTASEVQADAQIRQQQAQIAQSEAQLRRSRAQERQYAATARFDTAQRARYSPLAASGAETNEKADQYTSDAEKSEAQLDAARAQVSSDAAKVDYDKRQIEVYEAQRISAQAKIKQAQAMLAADSVDLDATTVVSRIAGRVGDRTVRVGQYLQAGTRIMTIVPVQALYLKANFKETQIGLMRVGQPARIKVDALDGLEINGTVESFSPGTGAQFSLIPTDNATGNFTKITQRVPVRIRLEPGPQARRVLVPGLSVTVIVDTISAETERDADAQEGKADAETYKREKKAATDPNRQNNTLGAGHE